MKRHVVKVGVIIVGVYAGPAVVYMLSIAILQFSVSCDGEIFATYSDAISKLFNSGGQFNSGEYGGFYFSATLVFIYVACILGFIYSFLSIKQILQGYDLVVFSAVACLFSGIGMAALLVLPKFFSLCVVELYFHTPLNLITKLQSVALGGKYFFNDGFLVWAFFIGVLISNLAWWFVAAAGAVTLVAKEGGAAEALAYDLAVRLARIRQIMYVAALVLISNTLSISAWLRWPSTYVNEPVLHDQLSGFGATLSFYYGTSMTVVLAVVFVPVLYILGEKSFALAQGQESLGSFAAQGKWLEEQGLSVDFKARLQDFGTVLAPMFAGSLSDLVDTIA